MQVPARTEHNIWRYLVNFCTFIYRKQVGLSTYNVQGGAKPGTADQQLGLSHFKLLLLKGEHLSDVFLLLQHQLNLNISGKIMEN